MADYAASLPQPHPIRALLVLKRITVTALAVQIEMNRTSVSRSVLGYTPPSPELRRRCAAALDLPEDQLFRLSSAQRLVEQSCTAQGLAVTVTDTRALKAICDLLPADERHHVLPVQERLRRAEAAKKLYFGKLALKSARARGSRAARSKGGAE